MTGHETARTTTDPTDDETGSADAPRVSVVLPTYDAADYVDGALDSLREQTFVDFEVLVVDDGSVDGTVDVVERHAEADERIRLLRRDGDDGLPAALNHGIEHARGEYVARQDADDRSKPERLERQVAYLDDHPDTALLGTGAELVDENGRPTDVRRTMPNPTFDDLLDKNRFVHGSVMMRRDAVEAVGGYDEGFRYSEDYDLWLRLANRHSVANLPSPLYALRMHDESIYGSELRAVKLYAAFARLRATDRTNLTVETVNDAGLDVVYDELDDGARAAFHAEMAQALLRYDRFSDARDHATRGVRLAPTTLSLWGLLALSYTTPGLVAAVERVYRAILNARGGS